jgi:hypothetical protein
VRTALLAMFALAAMVIAVPQASASPTCTAPDNPPFVIDPAMASAPQGHGRPADHTGSARVRAAVDNFVTCVNSGQYDKAVKLFTPYFINSFMGKSSYADAVKVISGTREEHMRLSDIRAYPDGSYTVEGRFLAYGHKIAHERWNLWDDGGFLKVNKLEPLAVPVPPDAATIHVDMGEYFFRLDRSTVCASNVVLRLRNVGHEGHEAIVLKLPEGAVPEDLLTGRVQWSQVAVIGEDNGADMMSLIRLDPGTYSLFDFIPAADGTPHAVHGQTAQFRVAC